RMFDRGARDEPARFSRCLKLLHRPLNFLTAFITSSIGRKWIVALTGLLMLGFLVGHLLGNLQVFLPPEHINRYAAFLQGLGELLWLIRLFLLATVVLHIVFTIQLAIENRRG